MQPSLNLIVIFFLIFHHSATENVSEIYEEDANSTIHRAEVCPEDYLPEDTTFATRSIHAGYKSNANSSWSIIPPIYLSTTYFVSIPEDPLANYAYSRIDNPSRASLEKYLAAVEMAEYALTFPSGMAAMAAVLQILRNGDHIICMEEVYGGSVKLLKEMATNFNLSVSFHDFNDLQNLKSYVTPRTALIWLESPTNPRMRVVDVAAISKVVKAKNNNTLIAIDNTFQTPYFQKPLSLSADIVMYSLSKYMNGHSDVVMGSIAVNREQLHKELLKIRYVAGNVPSSFDCYLAARGLKTLQLRMKQHMASGLEVAKFLMTHAAVTNVLHPGLETHPDYCLAKKQWSGYSGMLAFNHTGGYNESLALMKNVKYFQYAGSLGGFESLIAIPSRTSHAALSADLKRKLGMTDNFIRLSVGLEATEDLISDLDRALNTAVLKIHK